MADFSYYLQEGNPSSSLLKTASFSVSPVLLHASSLLKLCNCSSYFAVFSG